MKEFHIEKNDAGQRCDRWLSKAVPLLPSPLMQKYFRLKRFKCNGKPAKKEQKLQVGDCLSLYINDEFFQKPSLENAYLLVSTPRMTVVYEDEHILIVNKPAGLVVHSDESGETNNLLTHIQAYLYQTKAWRPKEELTFSPALCNRIDRNTSGLVISAKTAVGLRAMNEKIKERDLSKEYLAVIHGTLPKKQGKLEHFILRDKSRKQVSVHETPTGGAKTAITHYDVLTEYRGLSLVRCTLITGRTHQIRAQFAHIDHPLLGDGKYGSLDLDKPYKQTAIKSKMGKPLQGQALCAYRLKFPPYEPSEEGDDEEEELALKELGGRVFQVEEIDFLSTYFPEYTLKKSDSKI